MVIGDIEIGKTVRAAAACHSCLRRARARARACASTRALPLIWRPLLAFSAAQDCGESCLSPDPCCPAGMSCCGTKCCGDDCSCCGLCAPPPRPAPKPKVDLSMGDVSAVELENQFVSNGR